LEYEYSRVAATDNLRFGISVPKNFANYQVKVDVHLLERLLRNLITNAIRYTPKGGVRLAARLSGNFVDIRVVDTGLGIPLAQRSRIFEEFVQIRNPQAKEKNIGMGLGLAISRRLSAILGSQLRMNTHVGIGSVFAFKLPVRNVMNSGLRRSAANDRQDQFAPISGSLIVVVDDDANICLSTKSMLELYGAEVITAESGDAAVQALIFSPRPPDLVLSDYRLTNETGLQCVQTIRDEFNSDIPAIIVTGDTAPHEINLLKQAGMDILYKPVPAESLLASISKNLLN